MHLFGSGSSGLGGTNCASVIVRKANEVRSWFGTILKLVPISRLIPHQLTNTMTAMSAGAVYKTGPLETAN